MRKAYDFSLSLDEPLSRKLFTDVSAFGKSFTFLKFFPILVKIIVCKSHTQVSSWFKILIYIFFDNLFICKRELVRNSIIFLIK